MTHPNCVPSLTARAKGLVLFFLATLPLAVAGALSPGPAPQPAGSVPSPEIEPAEVVRIQVEALRQNSFSNEGIELTYHFASPRNKRYTGPLERFIDMVRSAPYDRLLNHRSAEYSPMAVSGNQAQQMVVIIDAEGEEVGYVWVLSRQTKGAFKDCWMTDAVIAAEREVQRQLTQDTIPLERVSTYSARPQSVPSASVAWSGEG